MIPRKRAFIFITTVCCFVCGEEDRKRRSFQRPPPWSSSSSQQQSKKGHHFLFSNRLPDEETRATSILQDFTQPPSLDEYRDEYMRAGGGDFRGEVQQRRDNHDDTNVTNDSLLDHHHSPLVYRFYGRSRTHSVGSIPFVLIGPNVDHFKATAVELAARGFSVLACERLREENENRSSGDKEEEDGALLIRELLDALRWNRVVLVGCDRESVIAIQAALQLAPDRVVGLVLCGDMTAAQDFFGIESKQNKKNVDHVNLELDRFLQVQLKCPFTVVWDGDAPPLASSSSSPHSSPEAIAAMEALVKNRYLILGGGTAPHRRRAELFAWVLTRFVEERIAPDAPPPHHATRGGQQHHDMQLPEPRPIDSPYRLREFFSPESFVVVGRVVAAILFYWTFIKVFVYQSDNVCEAMLSIRTGRRNIVKSLSSLVSRMGSVFVFSSPKDDGPLDSNVITLRDAPPAEPEVEEEEAEVLMFEEEKEKEEEVPEDVHEPVEEEEFPCEEEDFRLPPAEEEVPFEEEVPIEPRPSRPTPTFYLDHVVA